MFHSHGMSEGVETSVVVTNGAPYEGIPVLAARGDVVAVKPDSRHPFMVTIQHLPTQQVQVTCV